jgi:hypothetical protein
VLITQLLEKNSTINQVPVMIVIAVMIKTMKKEKNQEKEVLTPYTETTTIEMKIKDSKKNKITL